MVNYNFENPEERGFWYDCEITKVINTKSQKTVIGTVSTSEKSYVEGYVNLIDQIFKIEQRILLSERNQSHSLDDGTPVQRKSGFNCATCKDNQRRKCKDCGCSKCGGKKDPEKQLMCDECDRPYHIFFASIHPWIKFRMWKNGFVPSAKMTTLKSLEQERN